MGTPSHEEAQRILEDHLRFVEAHPDQFPVPKSVSDLSRMNLEAHELDMEDQEQDLRHTMLVRHASRRYDSVDVQAMSDEELLHAVVIDALSHPETADFELSQIYSGTVQGDPEQEALWAKLTGPLTLQADFHLDGAAVRGHSIVADYIVDLVKGIASAAKSTAEHELAARRKKQTAEGSRSTRTLDSGGGRPIRLAAISPGSFEFVLEADSPAPPKDAVEGQLIQHSEVYTPSIDDTALTAVVDALFSDGSKETLEKLPKSAQRALYPAAQTLANEDLEVTSQLTQRNLTPVRHKKMQASASALVRQLERPHEDHHEIHRAMKFDGYKQSENIVYLFIDKAKSKAVTVEDDHLLTRLKGFPSTDGKDLWLDANVTVTVTKSVNKNTKTELTLTYAQPTDAPDEEGEQLTLDQIVATLSEAD